MGLRENARTAAAQRSACPPPGRLEALAASVRTARAARRERWDIADLIDGGEAFCCRIQRRFAPGRCSPVPFPQD